MHPGWRLWNDESGGVTVWVFRPDVFNASEFPASWLPTLTVKPARERGPRGRPGRIPREWWIELRLEPDVLLDRRTTTSRDEAIDVATTLAAQFMNGEYSFAAGYSDPPAEYLDMLAAVLDDG